jgi:flagellar biogenesis protein FliO
LIKLKPKKILAIEINKYHENMEGRTLTARIKVMVIDVDSNPKK